MAKQGKKSNQKALIENTEEHSRNIQVKSIPFGTGDKYDGSIFGSIKYGSKL